MSDDKVVQFPGAKPEPHSVESLMKDLQKLHAEGKITQMLVVAWHENGTAIWRTKMEDDACAYGIALLNHRLMRGLDDAWRPADE